MFLKKKKSKKGFTLVELVVVIAVIAVLSAVSIGAYFGVIAQANLSNDEQMVAMLNKNLQTEYLNEKPETVSDMYHKLQSLGYTSENLKTYSSNYHYVYDKGDNRFYLFDKEDKCVYPTIKEDYSSMVALYREGGVGDYVSTVSNYLLLESVYDQSAFNNAFKDGNSYKTTTFEVNDMYFYVNADINITLIGSGSYNESSNVKVDNVTYPNLVVRKNIDISSKDKPIEIESGGDATLSDAVVKEDVEKAYTKDIIEDVSGITVEKDKDVLGKVNKKEYGTLTFDGVTFIDYYPHNAFAFNCLQFKKIIFNNCTFIHTTSKSGWALWLVGNYTTYEVTNCTFNTTRGLNLIRLTTEGNKIENNTFNLISDGNGKNNAIKLSDERTATTGDMDLQLGWGYGYENIPTTPYISIKNNTFQEVNSVFVLTTNLVDKYHWYADSKTPDTHEYNDHFINTETGQSNGKIKKIFNFESNIYNENTKAILDPDYEDSIYSDYVSAGENIKSDLISIMK